MQNALRHLAVAFIQMAFNATLATAQKSFTLVVPDLQPVLTVRLAIQ